MLTVGPTSANRLIDKEEITSGLPADSRIVRDFEIFTFSGASSLVDAKGAATGPKSVHRGGSRSAIQVDDEGTIRVTIFGEVIGSG